MNNKKETLRSVAVTTFPVKLCNIHVSVVMSIEKFQKGGIAHFVMWERFLQLQH